LLSPAQKILRGHSGSLASTSSPAPRTAPLWKADQSARTLLRSTVRFADADSRLIRRTVSVEAPVLLRRPAVNDWRAQQHLDVVSLNLGRWQIHSRWEAAPRSVRAAASPTSLAYRLPAPPTAENRDQSIDDHAPFLQGTRRAHSLVRTALQALEDHRAAAAHGAVAVVTTQRAVGKSAAGKTARARRGRGLVATAFSAVDTLSRHAILIEPAILRPIALVVAVGPRRAVCRGFGVRRGLGQRVRHTEPLQSARG
jgi:hypothetical protein